MPTSWSETMLRETRPLVFEEPIGLSIVSDSQLLCEGLVALFGQYVPRCTVAVYTTGAEIPESLPQQPFQLALMDASTGIERTVRSIRAWHAAHPDVAILTLELPDKASEIVACIEAGATGYTLRGAGIDAVFEALLRLRSGQAACSLEIAAQVFARLSELRANPPALADPSLELTEREREVLAYLAADCSNQEIARRLVIEVRTVKHHVHNILAKLKAHHRWQAVMVARDLGLLH